MFVAKVESAAKEILFTNQFVIFGISYWIAKGS